MNSYTDRDGFVWEGAVIQCLGCVHLENIKNKGKCNSYDNRVYFCIKHYLCEREIRERFGVGITDRINCDEWRPGN